MLLLVICVINTLRLAQWLSFTVAVEKECRAGGIFNRESPYRLHTPIYKNRATITAVHSAALIVISMSLFYESNRLLIDSSYPLTPTRTSPGINSWQTTHTIITSPIESTRVYDLDERRVVILGKVGAFLKLAFYFEKAQGKLENLESFRLQ